MKKPKSGRVDLAVAVAQAEAAFRADQQRIAGLPHKSVNGVLIELTPEEVAALHAEWKAEHAEAAKPKPPTLHERVATLETALAALKRATK